MHEGCMTHTYIASVSKFLDFLTLIVVTIAEVDAIRKIEIR